MFTNDVKIVTINMKQDLKNYHKRAAMEGTLTENTYTAVIEKTDKWYIAYIEEIPGANAQGKTIDEAKENLKEAVELIILSNRELSEREFRGKDVIREKIRVSL